jgi:succinoglycan biosynthesis protein ExoO
MPSVVSVVVPAFNAANFIARSIESALAQTFREIDVIVVDDGSVDHTAAVVDRFVRRDSRVRLLRHVNNEGVSAARNTAIAAAHGDWITLLDSDDTYAPERLCRLLERAARMDADMVADNIMLTSYPGGKHLHAGISPEGRLFDSPISLPDFLEYSSPGGFYFGLSYLQPIVRRAFLAEHRIRYRENLRACEDFVFGVDCLINGANFWVVPETYYFYSIRPRSLCSTTGNYTARHGLDLTDEFLNHPAVVGRPEWVQAFLTRQSRVEAHLSYERWVKALKRAQLIRAGILLAEQRHRAPVFLKQILAAIARRVQSQPRALPRTLQHRPHVTRGRL